MNMKKLICGIAALMLIALATGCPSPTTVETPEKTTYVLSGTVSADIDVDLTEASIQLIQNGSPILKPVHPASDGSFEISGVPAGNGFVVQATLDGFVAAETDAFNVPEGAAGLELQLKKVKPATYDLSGTVSADIDVDLTEVSIQLIQNGNAVSTAHPAADGSFEISGVSAGEGFMIRATLDGFAAAETETFSVPGTGAGFELLLEKIMPATANIIGFITIDKAGVDPASVEVILYYMGGEQRRTHPNALKMYVFTDVEQKTSADYKVAAILEGFDTAESQPFALTEDYNVPTLDMKTTVTAVTEMQIADASVLYLAPLMSKLPRLKIVFDVDPDPATASVEGWSLVGSKGGNIALSDPQAAGNTLMLEMNPGPAAGETFTLSYTAPAGGGLKGIDGSTLANFTNMAVEFR